MGFEASDRVRERIRKAGGRFLANHNIADHIADPAEMAEIEAEVRGKVGDLLRSLVIDVDQDHNTSETADRVARMFCREVFAGRYEQKPKVTRFPNVEKVDEITVIGPIDVRSACAHHLVPIIGECFVAVIYGKDLIGLSKFHRLTEWVCSRPQIQEEAAKTLADELEKEPEPVGLYVIMRARHMCCGWRGVRQKSSQMVSSVLRGRFLGDTAARNEALALFKGVGL